MKIFKSNIICLLISMVLFACANNENGIEKDNQVLSQNSGANVISEYPLTNENKIEGNNQILNQINDMNAVSEYPLTQDVDLCDTIKFGKYEIDANVDNGLEDIEWLLLTKDENSAMLISKYILDCKQFVSDTEYLSREWPKATKRYIDNGGNENDLKEYENELKDYLISEEYGDDYNECTWKNSTLRHWLNNDFYNTAFSDEEKKLLLLSEYSSIRIKLRKDLYEENITNDVVSILNKDELKKYFKYDYKINSILAYARPTKYAKNISNRYINVGLEIRNDGILSGYANYWLRDQDPFSNPYTIFDNLEFKSNNFESENKHCDWPDSCKVGVRPVIKIRLNQMDGNIEYSPTTNEKIDFKSRPFVDRNIKPAENQNETIDFYDPFPVIFDTLNIPYKLDAN